MEKISVIIPVYNTGKYLAKCVNSILCQTYQNLEILIIDDGSEEYTAAVCDELSKKDSRISVFHKQNEGVSVARNFGIEKATGEYIGFVDSDDWVDNDMYGSMLSVMQKYNADIVYCEMKVISNDKIVENEGVVGVRRNVLVFDSRKIYSDTLCLIAGSACVALYRNSIVENLNFPEKLKFSEDRYFNLQAIAKSGSICYLKRSLYNRFVRMGSCVNSYHSDGVAVIKRAYDLIFPFVADTWGNDYLRPFKYQKANSYMAVLYGVLKSKKSICSKFKEIFRIASDEDFQLLLHDIKPQDIRFKLILEHRYCLLFALIYFHDLYKRNLKRL